ncbi:hypothetical protein [Mucisphaera calidilacus]|uniref:Uncharacterized protein n=1 Tax=Mucisphaera calidilacus TaxID=2527982 RepID=A0A518BXB3_9BACT|nr:hypothetical protein [Mucisphaera calidilacus]QDU71622.1 hypothetical protein Pan265_14740 [Mucisphaera calidilacus]
MPSSTSSSSDRLPRKHVISAALGAVVVFVLLLGAYELTARLCGFTPGINDSMANWSAHRDRVADKPGAIAFVGTSRMTAAIDVPLVRERYPDRAVAQLAIDATQPASVLRDLAEDPAFTGVIICSVSPAAFKEETLWSQEPWVVYYEHRWSISEMISYRVGYELDRCLATRQPSWSFISMISTLAKTRTLPTPSHRFITEDRSRCLDFSKVDQDKLRETIAGRRDTLEITPPEQWLANAALMEPGIEQLMERGGRVVYVRLPVAHEPYEYDREVYPRAQYWDALAEATSATMIHFEDVAGMNQIPVPDGSHIDMRSQAELTRLLMDEVERLGVLD